MAITALYAGCLALLFVLLSIRVIAVRRGARISVGDGGNTALLRRMRVHANFTEYVPMALILIGLLETLQADPRLLHGLGVLLLAGRLMHAAGMSLPNESLPLRVTGMAFTFTVLISGAVACLWSFASRF